MEYTSLKQLLEEWNFKSIEEFVDYYSKESEYGIDVEFRMVDGKWLHHSEVTDLRNVRAFLFNSELAGGGRISCGAGVFGDYKNPVTDLSIENALTHIEGLVDEYLVEEEEDIDVACFIEEEAVEDDEEWVYGEVIPFRSDYFDEENIEY